MKGVKTQGSILGVGDGGGGPILKHMLPEHDKYYEKLWTISHYIIKKHVMNTKRMFLIYTKPTRIRYCTIDLFSLK